MTEGSYKNNNNGYVNDEMEMESSMSTKIDMKKYSVSNNQMLQLLILKEFLVLASRKCVGGGRADYILLVQPDSDST